ncbi:MAG: hypothetical protein ABFE01_12395, partial [Phycisphaerales bacterium]
MIGETGRVSRLHVLDAVVRIPSTGGTPSRGGGSAVVAYFGILAGCNYGTIADCSATGIVMPQNTDGGLVGINLGSMTNCDGDVIVMSSGVIVGR